MSRIFLAALFATSVMSVGCDEGAKKSRRDKFNVPVKCKTDEGCAKNFICQTADNKMANGADGVCQKGERSAAEKAAIKKAKAEARAKKVAAKTAVKPGEGRMIVRVCPGFDNTPATIGTITAIHQKSKKKYQIHMAMVVPDNEMQANFVFHSLPLGKYDVSTTYGVQVKGVPDLITIKCHEDHKDACRDGKIREIEVVLPKDEPKPELDKEGKPKKRLCDFLAE